MVAQQGTEIEERAEKQRKAKRPGEIDTEGTDEIVPSMMHVINLTFSVG